MKKLLSFFFLFIAFLLLSTSCSENSEQPSSPQLSANSSSLTKNNVATTNSEQPSSPSSKSNSSTLNKSNVVSTNAGGQYGKLGLIGKMFDKNEANNLFGNVTSSLTISAADLKAALDKGNDYILITVKNNQVVIRNEKRGFLSRERVDMGKDEKMYMYSKSMIQNLLKAKKTGKNGTSELGANTMSTSATASDLITVEVRASVISLSYGDATLELAMPCPPICTE